MGAKKKPAEDNWPDDYQDQFWKTYPRRVAKIAAMKALDKARAAGVDFAKILTSVEQYKEQIARKRTEPQYVAHPATWLNQGRWDDEPDVPAPAGGPGRGPSLFEIATGRDRQ